MSTLTVDSRLVDAATAAQILGVHKRTIYDAIAAGRLPARRIGAHIIRIGLDDLDRFARPVTNTEGAQR